MVKEQILGQIGKFDYEYGTNVKEFNELIFLRLKSISDECGAELNIFFNNWALPEVMMMKILTNNFY